MAFAVHRHDPPAIEVRVNFGVFAGREATAAEIDRLAEWLLDEVGEVSIISEERHEIDAHVEASVHQVRIEVGAGPRPGDRPSATRSKRASSSAPSTGRASASPSATSRSPTASRERARRRRACASPDAARPPRAPVLRSARADPTG